MAKSAYGGKSLLHNWVEERATASLDSEASSKSPLEAKAHKHGHKGIISVDVTSKFSNATTVKEEYTPPKGQQVRMMGARTEFLANQLYQTISKEVQEESNRPPSPVELVSTARCDYKIEGFQSVPPPSKKRHDYKSEQAITYWSENYKNVQGVTAARSKDNPFKKNTSFSKPISESLDNPVPYELEKYPNL
ncbi:sperm associated antigen 8 [Polypterus senegalus]|uniref:sperm associated antigen 8 n=1 Tax=Polypterus senegalus TaxID=55291 RepID=UPI001964CB59|nr:sperm associated antigen 8 [Polypterus senegalus]